MSMRLSPGTLTLMGSGELTESMAKVHRSIASKIEGPVRPVFLDTPAGFELNADNISERAVEYVRRHLGVPCAVASFKSAAKASEREEASALRKLEGANFIFAGPGSPTYAIRNWRGTPVWDAVVRRVSEGAHLVLASAAAIAISRCSLPVYEVYKVGEEPRWVDGLNLLGPHGLDLAIVTHWNNTEGGTYDTRFCYMGQPRFEALEKALPPSSVVLGIDEYTACIIDLAADEAQVMAAGSVTVRNGGRETVYESGNSFSLDVLRRREGAKREGQPPMRAEARGRAGEDLPQRLGRAEEAVAQSDRGARAIADVADDIYELAQAVDTAEQAGAPENVVTQARTKLGHLVVDWSRRLTPETEAVADIAPFVDLLIDIRSRLREAKLWALSDEVRDRLSSLGIVLEDQPQGTSWHAAAPKSSGGRTPKTA